MGLASQSRVWVGYGYQKSRDFPPGFPDFSNLNSRRVGYHFLWLGSKKKSGFSSILGCASGSLRLPHLVQYHKIKWFCPWSFAKLL